jgi:histidine ammonia-lyase
MFQIGSQDITLNDFYDILFSGDKLKIAAEAIERVDNSFDFLKGFSHDKTIYGINTGFGPMAQYAIKSEDQLQLQYNLINSHASGAGNHIPLMDIKAAMIIMLKNLLQGYSGIHNNVVKLLAAFINLDIIPFVPEHGGVGASGDLVQLAHIALNLIGKGEVFYKGKLMKTPKVLEQNNLKPVEIHIREGIALMNGTSVMTGISIVNVIKANRLLNWSLIASALLNEIVQSFDDYFSEELNSVKQHKGQHYISEKMRMLAKGSKLIKKREYEFYNGNGFQSKIGTRVQEYYSIRCVPQVLGPVFETIENARDVFIKEANSVHDNPVIDHKSKNVYHGGNFHGDYVSFESDKLKIAVTKLSMVIERQLNFLMNDKLNKILPPFINLGTLGLNLGMQGMQFTATSTTAENQTLSFPMYVHSIPNNNDNQDIVSMGANSAMITKKVIDNAYQVMAIELIALLQAVDYLNVANKLSDKTKKIYDDLRQIFPKFVEDSPKYKDVENIQRFIQDHCVEDLI